MQNAPRTNAWVCLVWRAARACTLAFGCVGVIGLAQAAGDIIGTTAADSDPRSVCRLNTPGQPRTLVLPGDVLPPLHSLPDGRNALVATRSGWVLRVDLAQAQVTARLRVSEGLTTTALSASRAGLPSLLAVANDVPRTLVVLDEWLNPVQTLRLADKTGHISSAVLGIQTTASRQSFVLALKNVPELWEISYNPFAPEIGLGWVHDYQYREGQFVPGYLNPQRTVLQSLISDFALTEDGHAVITQHTVPNPNDAATSATTLQVVHLDVRRHVSAMPVPPWPAALSTPVAPWVCEH
jgi:hypothetical protein